MAFQSCRRCKIDLNDLSAFRYCGKCATILENNILNCNDLLDELCCVSLAINHGYIENLNEGKKRLSKLIDKIRTITKEQNYD